MLRHKTVHGIAIAAFLCTASSQLAAEERAANSWDSLAQEVGRVLAATNNPRAALIIVDHGSIAVSRDYGQQSAPGVPDQTPVQGNTPFRLGSITKLFTALALLHASSATNTPLDTPLHDILDQKLWQNPWRQTHPVRLHQLAELSAGFADISGPEFASAEPLPPLKALAIDPDSHTTRWPPGLQHSYTNLAPAYSALAVEVLTGQSFAAYLQRYVLQPLGMPDATLQPLADLPGGFKADGVTPIPYWHTIYPAFGGLNATPNQFANLLLAMTSGNFGPTLNPAIARRGVGELWQPTSTAAARAGLTLGYGAGIYATIRDEQLIYGHGGDADGYRSRFGVIGNSTRGYFLAINSDNPRLLRRLQALVEQQLIIGTDKPVPPVERSSTPPHAALERFVGTYYKASRRFSLGRKQDEGNAARIHRVGKRLQFKRGSTSTELLWLGGNRFRRNNDPVATLVFVEANNALYLQGELGNWQRSERAVPSP